MTYTLASAAYDGRFSYYAVSDDIEIGFDTKGEALEFIAQANDTPEWKKHCLEAVEPAELLKFADKLEHYVVVRAFHEVLDDENSAPIDEMRAARILRELGETHSR